MKETTVARVLYIMKKATKKQLAIVVATIYEEHPEYIQKLMEEQV
jgi:hypothetical protein